MHTDLGVKHAFRITVDSPNQISESNEKNNVYKWEQKTVPGFAYDYSLPPSKPQYQQLKIANTKSSPGKNNTIDVLVYNAGNVPSYQTNLFLSFKDYITGGGIKDIEPIAPIQPGQSMWFTLTADQSFVIPETSSVRIRRKPPVVTTVVAREPRKWLIGKSKSKVYQLSESTDYKITKPFVLMIDGNTEDQYYMPKSSRGGGVIHIPGK